MGYSPWGHKESDTTERLTLLHFSDRARPSHFRSSDGKPKKTWCQRSVLRDGVLPRYSRGGPPREVTATLPQA